MNVSEFLHMGGYAAYVWSSYGIWLVVMVVNVILPMNRLRETQSRLGRRYREENTGT